KTERDIIFRDELNYLQSRFPNLHVTVTLTRAEGSSEGWERGRISPELLHRVVPEISTRRVHICGPTEMTELTRQMLLDLGVPAESIKSESFTSPARAALVSRGLVSGGVVSGGVVNGGAVNDPTTHHSPLTTHHSPTATAVNGAATLTFARSG